MNRQAFSIVGLLAFCIGVAIYSTSFRYTHRDTLEHQLAKTPKERAIINDPLPQVVRSSSLNKVFSFAGEDLPYDNFDALERLDRELIINSYRHSSTLINLKRSNRYFPVFERIMREEGVPDDFKYLAVAESGLDNVTSPAGAKGLWQFMSATAKAYDLQINNDVDERYHIEKATRAACRLLKNYKQRFGSWTLAAAAYNVGETRLSKEMNSQKETKYYDLNLNRETSRYIFRLIAFKEIMQNPSAFGFYVQHQGNIYQELSNYRSIDVNTSISNLGEFAHQHGTTYRMLKVYNPWLISGDLSNSSGKSYQIRVPN